MTSGASFADKMADEQKRDKDPASLKQCTLFGSRLEKLSANIFNREFCSYLTHYHRIEDK